MNNQANSDSNENQDKQNPWEILGIAFAIFATIKDAPDTLRQLNVQKLIPSIFKAYLCQINPDGNFWFSLFYISVSAFSSISLILYLRKKPLKKIDEKQDRINKIVRYLRYQRLLRAIRSLGLALVRDLLLDKLHSVSSYGTFKRPSIWPEEKLRSKFIDRIRFKDGRGYEFQYSSDYSKIILSEHPSDSDFYIYPSEEIPQWQKAKILLLASDYFPFWFAIYLVRKSFNFFRCRKVKS